VCKHRGINNLQERRTDDQTANVMGPRVICKKVPIATCSHKLIIISELNVIPAIQWKGKIVLASTLAEQYLSNMAMVDSQVLDMFSTS
jgi:hypothetical protein